MYIALEPLIDSDDQEVVDEVIRMISNQVGVGKEWANHNY